MKINNQPLVPQAALERAQGEIDSLYVQIVDLHGEIEKLSEAFDEAQAELSRMQEQATADAEKIAELEFALRLRKEKGGKR